MFKKILLAAVVAATASFAQINVGVRGAVDMNTLWGDNADDAASGIGFQAGAGVKISLPLLPITVAPEVVIDMRNYDLSEEVTSTEWALDIPILIRFSLMPILYLEAGPMFAFNLSVSAEDDDGNEVKFDDDYFNTFEFDLVFGVGTGIVPFVDIDFRVNLGMTKTEAEHDVLGIATVKAREAYNLQFVLGATYWF